MPIITNYRDGIQNIVYQEQDIECFLQHNSFPEAKFGLTQEGYFTAKGKTLALENCFIGLDYFAFQKKTYAEWKQMYPNLNFETAIVLMTYIIAQTVITKTGGQNIDKQTWSLAENHLHVLQNTFLGDGFSVPGLILGHICNPLGIKLQYYQPNVVDLVERKMSLYYQESDKCWVFDTKDQMLIIDPQISDPGAPASLQFGVSAKLQFDPYEKSSTCGFKLTNMMLQAPTNYIKAVDLFLYTQQGWKHKSGVTAEKLLIRPLRSFKDEQNNITPRVHQTHMDAARHLKRNFKGREAYDPQNNYLRALYDHPRLAAITDESLCFTAIRWPQLYAAITERRQGPQLNLDQIPLQTPPEGFYIERTYDQATLSKYPSLQNYQNAGYNKLWLNNAFGFGLYQLSGNQFDNYLAKDFLQDLRIEGKPCKHYNLHHEKLKDTLSNPFNYKASLQAVKTIIQDKATALTQVPQGQTERKVLTESAPQWTDLCFETMKRAYYTRIYSVPFEAFYFMLQTFANNFEIKVKKQKFLSYYDVSEKEAKLRLKSHWRIEIKDIFCFEIKGTTVCCFQQFLECNTTLMLPLPTITSRYDLIDLTNNTEVLQDINENRTNGFVLQSIELLGHKHYHNLFEKFLNWDSRQGDFKAFILQPLTTYIKENSNPQSDGNALHKLKQSVSNMTLRKTSYDYKTSETKVKAAQALHTTLTTNNKVMLSEQERSALLEPKSRLRDITSDLIFFIGLKDPDLYNDLKELHYNPIIPSLVNTF